ncbi:MAG: mevalonate kinase [Anaerolineae bacterium]|nr:mevalonate kinase [Anaerolineae bacterium]
MQVSASAPGKLVLFGDHAVVHGYPGIVTAVDRRYYVTASIGDNAMLQVRTSPDRQHELPFGALPGVQEPDIAFVVAAVNQLLSRKMLKRGLRLVTSGPCRSLGLGSSSAISVATLAAASQLFGLDLSPEEIYKMARAAVLDVQGAGSGLDVAAAVYGGTCYFERAGEVPEMLSVERLPLVIAYSGSKAGTVDLVQEVAALRSRHPDLVEPVFAMIGRICIRARSCLEEGRWCDLGALTNINQGLLEALGTGTAKLANLVYAARSAQAWGAKLSGAGGGDCMFAWADDSRRAQVIDRLEAAGGEVAVIACGVPGVQVVDEA